jgi:hypothetical protein
MRFGILSRTCGDAGGRPATARTVRRHHDLAGGQARAGDAERSLRDGGGRVSSQVDEWFDKNVRVLRAAATLPAMASMSADAERRR